MAILLPKSNTLILLTPKTGSKWIRHVIKEIQLEYLMIGNPNLRGHDPLSHFDREKYSYIASFVRHPLSWHYSYWQYRNSEKSQWEPDREELDRLCMSKSFEKYMSNVFRYKPEAITTLYEQFTGTYDNPVDFIGKQENLVNDFIFFLTSINEIESAEEILCLGNKNINKGKNHPENIIKYSKQLYKSDLKTYIRFGYNIFP